MRREEGKHCREFFFSNIFNRHTMRVTIVNEANNFIQFLRLCQDDNKDSWVYQEHFKISKCNDEPLLSMIEGSQPVFICEKMPPPVCESENTESSDEISFIEETPVKPPELNIGPLPLSISKAREMLSWYTMSQNPYMSQVDYEVLCPLWVRCDKQDPANTSWLGAEPVYTGDKVTAVKLYTVICKGSSVDEASFITIDQLKQEHQKRHHTSTVLTKGWAMYNLFCSVKEESLVIDSESSVTANFKWNNVEKTLEIPPLSSTVTLHIKVAAGDVRSPMYQTFRELEFLLTLAEGLKTEEIQWLEPQETRSAVDLSRALIEELENIANTVPGQNLKGLEKSRNDSVVGLGCMLTERGDLDFTEQLWEKMRRSVTSYQDITDSLKLVIKAVRLGRIKPWVHRDSSSSLSKLIVQSYQQQVDMVPLTGLTPAIMLLELGLDKMRKDYINYLVGNGLTTHNHLSYYLSSEVNLQEQVIRLRKLHHLMEVLGTCSSFLSLPHERLFLFTQSCLQYYKTAPYNEEHVFEMQIKPALISYFYQTEQPTSWGVEVSSGQGSREVKTSWHLSDKPLVDHINYDSDAPLEDTVNGENEKIAFFRTMVCCSLANFS